MATPSHVDLSVLWVPIMPETSKFDDTMAPAMEKAGKSAKDKFQQATKDIGQPITEELEKAGTKTQDKFKETGEKISETFRKSGKDSADKFGDELRQGSSKFDSIATTLGKNVGAKLGEAIHGGVGGALDKLEGVTKNIGVDISEWTTPLKDAASPLQDLQTGAGDIKTKIREWTADVESLPGKLGKVGTAIGELAGPISVVAASWAAAFKIRPWDSGPDWNKRDDGSVDPWKLAAGPVGTWLEKKYHNIFGGGDHPSSSPSTPSDYSDMLLGSGGASDQASSNFKPGGDPARWGGTLGSGGDAYDFFSSGQSLPAPGASAPKSADPVSPSTDKVPSSFVGSMPSSFSSPRDLKAGGSRVANLYAIAQSLEGTPYSQALRNDCSGMVSKLATAALGMSPSVQFSTVNEGDWLFSHGFKPGMGGPNDLSIGWYDHGGGNAGHTAATLPGGIHAESGGSGGGFRLGPGAAGADNPEFTNHAYLPMGGNAKMPAGTDSDPIYTAISKNAPSGQDSSQSQAEQLGQGFLGGIMQSVGLDGSVFKSFGGASNPMDFGITKLGTGLLNWGMGMAQQRTGGEGSMLPGLGALIPHAPAAQAQPGNTTIIHGDVNSGFQVTQNGVQGDGTQGFGEAYNSKVGSGRATAAPLPNASFGPSAGMP